MNYPQESYPTPNPSDSWIDSPFVQICISPRKTMRQIINSNPDKYVYLLAGLAGIGQFFGNLTEDISWENGEFIFSFLISLIVGPFLGIISLLIGSTILSWAGEKFGGVGTSQTIRAACAWGATPSIIWSFIWIPLVIAINVLPLSLGFLSFFVYLFFVMQIIVAFWSAIVLYKCLGEVQRFSAWKAFFVSLLPTVVILAIVFVCILPFMILG